MPQQHSNAQFKKILEEEQKLLESQLGALGKRNPSNPADWVPTKRDDDEFGADRNDNADIFEEMQDTSATLNELEARLNSVISALERIEAGTYGTCETCGQMIEQDRLSANPAATTCKEHMGV